MDDVNGQFDPGRRFRWFIVLFGIVLGQVILYGPSLISQKILLPLDILAGSNIYIPQSSEAAGLVPQDQMLADLVIQFEPARQFAVSEFHAGRFPMWDPHDYGGVPFVWPKYSLFLLLEYCVTSPVILAWVQLLAALVGGVGMYFFCRQLFRVGFWPAAVCAWCYPLTAFFALRFGYPAHLSVYWLPWIFLSVDNTIRHRNLLAVVGLSLVTFLVLTSGNIDFAGQVLLGAGIFALWCLSDAHAGEWFGRKARRAVALLVLGWGLGFLLAAPCILPLVEYARTGARMLQRSDGAEERPPTGLAALPQIVLPDIYGTFAKGSVYIIPVDGGTNFIESTAAGYTGVLATLVVAPLAWCSRRHRAMNLFWTFLAIFGLGWCLNIPGFVQLLRLPCLNMMSHNRLVFLTSFAILSMTAIGLENLLNGAVSRRRWFWLPALLLAGLCGWCLFRARVLPEPVATQLDQMILGGKTFAWLHDTNGVHQVQAWFIRHYTATAMFCGVGFVIWLLLWFQRTGRFRLFPVLVVLLLGDLLWFDHGRCVQCDSSLYYPPIPALDQIAQSAPGRIIGNQCLPASLAIMEGLKDIRGYDAIDPKRMVDLLKTAAVPGTTPVYAATQLLVPKGTIKSPGTIQLTPVMDMLDVRYIIFRGMPPPDIHPAFQSPDYWVLINSNALPRAFVPKSVEIVSDDRDELEKLSAPEFGPLDTAYVESPVNLPAACRGTAQITHEIPTRIAISVHMETPGLVVLADRWDKGWHAYYNGKPVPILQVDYAIRGVVVPAGDGTLEFVYKPASLILGLWLASIAAIILLCWPMIIWIHNRGVEKNSGGGERAQSVP